MVTVSLAKSKKGKRMLSNSIGDLFLPTDFSEFP